MSVADAVALAVFAGLVVLGVVVWWRFSLRRRLDRRQHEARGEEAQALHDIQRDIDRGKAAGQGFIPF